MSSTTPNILIINGSLRGRAGNSYALAQYAQALMAAGSGATSAILTLADLQGPVDAIYEQLCSSDGFLVISGVYWNSWSSLLQRFLEVSTAFEQTPVFRGKPVACAVSMDSVGGSEVAARIHAAFSGLGCWSPPCATVVVSRVGQEAMKASEGMPDNPNDDVWRLADLEIVVSNLLTASAYNRADWKQWPHTSLRRPQGDWPAQGSLDMGSPIFLP